MAVDHPGHGLVGDARGGGYIPDAHRPRPASRRACDRLRRDGDRGRNTCVTGHNHARIVTGHNIVVKSMYVTI